MASGAGRARRWRIVPQICVMAAVVAGVAGCVGMQSSGQVVELGASPQATQPPEDSIGPFPAEPQPGGSPSQIVQGFLVASASYPTYADIARQYLVSSASRAWQPTSAVTVFSNSPAFLPAPPQPGGRPGAPRAAVQVTGAVQATFDGSGQYVSAQGQGQPSGSYIFELVKVDGQWRITNPPSYRMLTATEFPTYYKAQDLYFLDSTDQVLVPDPVFVPLAAPSDVLVSNLVNALIAGPKTIWLQNATDTDVFPSGTTLLGVQLSGDVASVNLGGAMARADTTTRDLVAAQLVWTLTGSRSSPSGVQSVVLEIDGNAWTPPRPPCAGGPSPSYVQTQAAYACYDPYPSAPASFYYVNGGQAWSRCGSESQALQGSIGSVVPLVGRAGNFASPQCGSGDFGPEGSTAPPPGGQPQSVPPASMAVTSRDGRYLAIVSPGKDAVYVGTLSGNAASFPTTPRLTGAGITALSWDRYDNLWVAQNGNVFMVPPAGKAVLVPYSGGYVAALSVAPDGVRVGLTVSTGLGDELELAAIDWAGAQSTAGHPGQPSPHISLSPGVQLGPGITHPVSLTWYDADDLIVLNAAGDQTTLWEVPVDGQQPAEQQLPPAGAISISADSAANALVAGLSSGKLAVSAGLEGPWYTLNDPGQDPAYPG